MIIPDKQQFARVNELLGSSLKCLIDNDGEIFTNPEIVPRNLSNDARVLNRKLHEVTINHRFAYYLELNIQDTELAGYKVDLEYNRFYANRKLVQMANDLIEVRPDIIIHSRTNRDMRPQHYLVIEAKKEDITPHDLGKIRSLISDDNYNYLFGFAISYCRNPRQVEGVLLYFNGTTIIEASFQVQK